MSPRPSQTQANIPSQLPVSVLVVCWQQTEVLQLVFAIYFRILKNSRHSPLLQPVLEGLAKYLHIHQTPYIMRYTIYVIYTSHT